MKHVLEFYNNLSSHVGDERPDKFGKMYVRGKIYNFAPATINNFYNTPTAEEDGLPQEINEVASVLIRGLITQLPAHPGCLSTANFTSFYSAIHKTVILNWTLSTNTIVVIRPYGLVLFVIGTQSIFNFCKLVFKTVLQFADGGLKSTKLHFPSLI